MHISLGLLRTWEGNAVHGRNIYLAKKQVSPESLTSMKCLILSWNFQGAVRKKEKEVDNLMRRYEEEERCVFHQAF